jgi:membrane-bound metal-dependent hydrolase YbcI (DUF457 family)
MDPVSHVAFGRTLVALDSRRILGPGAIAACLSGSLAPDVDAVFMPLGWDIYLRRHQGGTHSLVGSIACAALAASAVRLLSRHGRFGPLLVAAWAGAAGHLLLDVISGADVRFFWPLGPPVALPLFAMADPWLGGVLVLGLVLIAAGRRNSARMAAAILLAVAVLAGGKAILYDRTTPDSPDGSVLFRRSDVEWGSLTRWVTYETRATTVDALRVNGWTGASAPLLHAPRRLDDPLIARSRELETVQNFVAAHGVTFATVIGARSQEMQVLWSDLRYCGSSRNRSVPWAPMPLESGLPFSCTLWFGGQFDPATNAPRASVVYLGHFVQRRPGP